MKPVFFKRVEDLSTQLTPSSQYLLARRWRNHIPYHAHIHLQGLIPSVSSSNYR